MLQQNKGYLGSDVYKLEMDNGCIYQGELFTTSPKIKQKIYLKTLKTYSYHGYGVEDCTRSSKRYLMDGEFIKGEFVSGLYKDDTGIEKNGKYKNGRLPGTVTDNAMDQYLKETLSTEY